ncbi:hypothetical protein ACQKEG_16955, partial [Klebsiella quasipneumoniae]
LPIYLLTVKHFSKEQMSVAFLFFEWAAIPSTDVDTLRAAKRFTRIALKPYLGGKPLKSRELFRQFMPARKARADNTKND